MDHRTARDWIEHEDDVARDDRVRRLEWLAANHPRSDAGFMLHGGWLSHQLLEEAKCCFAYGQFLATAIIGFALIERVLAARFYAAGRGNLKRAGARDLLREALASNWMSQEEFQRFDRVRGLRNPIAHFQRPLASNTLDYRAIQENAHPDEIVERDAQEILNGVFRMLEKCAL